MSGKVLTVPLRATLILFTVLAVERSALAQTKAMPPSSLLSVTPFEDPLIEIAAYNPAFHSIFSGLLSRAEFSHLAKIAVVVTNRSSQTVDGLLVQWNVPRRGLGTKTHFLPIDRYSRYQQQPVLGPSAQALITPLGYITEDQIGTNLLTSALSPMDALADFYLVPTNITVSLDSVIWADGGVTGLDRFKIIDYIQARHAVARSLAQRLPAQPWSDAALNRVLRTFVQEAATNNQLSSHYRHWINVLAVSARRGPNEINRLAAVSLPRLVSR
jgi:hypothetical protein